MESKEQALQNVSDGLARVVEIVSTLTPRQAAERAWHPGGPPLEELTEIIRGTGLCREDD